METQFATQEVVYAIAQDLNVPNEFIQVTKTHQDILWFQLKSGSAYTARTVRNGRALKKNSIRLDA